MLIDLGTRVSGHDWIADDLWASHRVFYKSFGHTPRIAGQTAGLFIGEIPITIPRDHEAKKINDMKSRLLLFSKAQAGEMGYAKDESSTSAARDANRAKRLERTGAFSAHHFTCKRVDGVSIACSISSFVT